MIYDCLDVPILIIEQTVMLFNNNMTDDNYTLGL